MYLTEEESGSSGSVGRLAGHRQPVSPAPQPRCLDTELRTTERPSGERNRGPDASDPRANVVRPPLSPRGFRKASGRRGVWARRRKRARRPASHRYARSRTLAATSAASVFLLTSQGSATAPGGASPGRAPGPPAPSPVTRRLPPPHSKFASALTHWLAGWRSREAAAHCPDAGGAPPLRASSRDALSSSLHIRAPAVPVPPGGRSWLSRRVDLPALFCSELLASGGGAAPRPLKGGYFRVQKLPVLTLVLQCPIFEIVL